jgi:hypothetical protein
VFLWLILSSLVAYPVSAETNKQLVGVWQGTLGSHPVTVCFNAENDFGSYYYHRYLLPIHLEVNQNGEVDENNKQASWQLHLNEAGALIGTWQKTDSDTPLPIVLRSITIAKKDNNDEFFEDTCGTNEFNNALEQPLVVKKSTVKYFENKPYRILSIHQGNNGSEAIELLGNKPYLKKANKLLTTLDGSEIFDCRRQALQGRGIDADWNYGINEVLFWTKRWFTYSSGYNVFCADLHFNWWNESTTIDFNTGQIAHLEKWFKLPKKDWQSDSPNYLPLERDSKLHRLILSYSEGYKDKDPEGCAESLHWETSYSLSLAKKGVLFTTSLGHAMAACNESVLVPYQKLMPFLTKLGKQEILALLKNSL